MNRFNLLVINSALAIFMHVATGKFPQLDAGKVIIDTDAGADDAAAIFMALNKEKDNSSFKVIAITCVHGNTAVENVVVNVFKILQTVGRLDIPVYRGASKSFIWTPPSDNYFGEDGFGDFESPNPPNSSDLLQNEHAVNALIQIVTQNPGEVTLLCLGPLTNVALAVRMDPTFLTKLKRLVALGGSTEGVGNIKPGIEFNFYMDPEAAFIVFNSSDTSTGHIRPITLVPYDSVSERNIVTMDWRKNVLGILPSAEVQILNKAEQYQLKENFLNWECADCLATAAILDPSLIQQSATFYAYVAQDGGISRGAMFVDYKGIEEMSPNIVIVRRFDVDRYKMMLLSTIGGVPSASDN